MPKREIEIIDSNASTDSLILSDRGITEVGNFFDRKVSWEIKDQKVESFRIVGKAPGDPFEDRPNAGFSTKVVLKVRLFGPTGDWNYSIIWKDKATHQTHTFDPKIAVNPIGPVAPILLFIVIIITSALAVQFNRKRRIRGRSTN